MGNSREALKATETTNSSGVNLLVMCIIIEPGTGLLQPELPSVVVGRECASSRMCSDEIPLAGLAGSRRMAISRTQVYVLFKSKSNH